MQPSFSTCSALTRCDADKNKPMRDAVLLNHTHQAAGAGNCASERDVPTRLSTASTELAHVTSINTRGRRKTSGGHSSKSEDAEKEETEKKEDARRGSDASDHGFRGRPLHVSATTTHHSCQPLEKLERYFHTSPTTQSIVIRMRLSNACR